MPESSRYLVNQPDDGAWRAFEAARNDHARNLRQWPVTPRPPATNMRDRLTERYSFREPTPSADLVREVSDLLREGTVHTTHPRHFGLFLPSIHPISVIAEALAALYNPQLAVWSLAPAANAIERHTLAYLLARLGLDPEAGGGCFTSGGAEANLSAAILALADRCPSWKMTGVRDLPVEPRIYVSTETHHSFDKIAVQTGLGASALRKIPVDLSLRMIPRALAATIAEDKAAGCLPLMVVGTAGTTGSGAIDPLPELAAIAEAQGLWFHVDAAFGGFACMTGAYSGCLEGIERADSITWDAHKGLSVPMGAGMFFCRDRGVMAKAFQPETGYMPASTEGVLEPYTSTMQWSRRFMGLKVFMALAELGQTGYQTKIEHQFRLGQVLRQRLEDAGWKLVHDTPLPVVCFLRPEWSSQDERLDRLVARIQERGRVWISKVLLTHHGWALRACITSYHSGPEDLDVLLHELEAVQ